MLCRCSHFDCHIWLNHSAWWILLLLVSLRVNIKVHVRKAVHAAKLLGRPSYEIFQRYNNPPPYVTARWLPQQIPSLNFLDLSSIKYGINLTLSHFENGCDVITLLCNAHVSPASFYLRTYLTYVTCYHKMSVRLPVCMQRKSLLNMSENNRKQRKSTQNTQFIWTKEEPLPTYHFKACIMKNLNLE